MDEVENVVIDVDELIDQAIGETFEEVENAEPGSEERKRLHDEAMDLLKVKLEREKMLQDESNKLDKEKEGKKNKFWDSVKFGVDCMFKGLGIFVPAWLCFEMYKFSAEGNFMSSDETRTAGLLFNQIKRQ